MNLKKVLKMYEQLGLNVKALMPKNILYQTGMKLIPKKKEKITLAGVYRNI
jgi:hypothetical protein